jgi:hypothetical protein
MPGIGIYTTSVAILDEAETKDWIARGGGFKDYPFLQALGN